jgi:hypothetical protein
MNFDDFLDQVELPSPVVSVSGTDPRIKQLSYSSLTTLHSCPRKFQLYKLQSKEYVEAPVTQSVTFAYGHAVGTGIQSVLEDKTESQIWLDCLAAWDCDLLATNPKQKKSFPEVMICIEQFQMLKSSILDGWELLYWNGKPAVELPFLIHMPDGFVYRGFVDAVLHRPDTGEVKVLEVKSTSATSVNPSQYKNSFQAVGYSIVLDTLFPGLSHYSVLYLPWLTKSCKFQPMEFNKLLADRARWLRDLIYDVELIKFYDQDAEVGYPMRGESCNDWFRDCEYFGACQFNTSQLTVPLTQKVLDKIEADQSKFYIQVSFNDLLDTQFKSIGE